MASETESIGRRIRTGVVVFIITLLIWIAADQWVTTEVPFSITIQPVNVSRNRYVAFAEPPFHRTISITVRGRRSRIEAFRSKYEASEGQVIKIPIDDLHPTSTEPQELATADDLLRFVPELRQTGVVLEAEPASLPVRIDRYVEVTDIPVRFDFGEVRVRDNSTTRKISARMPGFVEADEQFRSNRHAVVHAAPLILDRTPGRKFDFMGDVVLELPMELPPETVQLFPEKIRIVGQVETLETTVHRGPITVKWSVPDSVQRDYAIIAESGEFVGVHLDVRGPKDRVAQLDASKIRAFVEILAGDLASPGPDKLIIRDVVILLPPEFSDCKLLESTEPRQVRFRLVKRGVPPGTAVEGEGVGE